MTPLTPRKRATHAPAGGWMVTLTDLGFLVLAFFVVQFATATPRPAAWLDLRESLARELAPALAASDNRPTADLAVPLHDEAAGLDTRYLRARLDDAAMPVLAPLGAAILDRPDAVVIALPARPANAGSWADADARAALATAGDALRFIDNRIAVVGVAARARGAPDVEATRLGQAFEAAATVADALAQGGDALEIHARFAGPDDPAAVDGELARIDIVVRAGAGGE